MSKINLLPWREERRRELKNQFVAVLFVAAALGAGGVYVLDSQVNAQIAHQQARNEFIRQEMSSLDAQITEIGELKKKRERLVERMGVIQNLQGNRPLIVHVFDELARTTPDGVFYTSLAQSGNGMSATGMAESNTRISNLMRNLENAPHFGKPVLSKVEAQVMVREKTADKNWSGFNLSFQIDEQPSSPKPGEG